MWQATIGQQAGGPRNGTNMPAGLLELPLLLLISQASPAASSGFSEPPYPVSQSPQAAITKYHRLGDLNSRHLFLSAGGWEVEDQGAGRWASF